MLHLPIETTQLIGQVELFLSGPKLGRNGQECHQISSYLHKIVPRKARGNQGYLFPARATGEFPGRRRVRVYNT